MKRQIIRCEGCGCRFGSGFYFTCKICKVRFEICGDCYLRVQESMACPVCEMEDV